LILSMMRSFNRRTGSVRSRMRILSAGIILGTPRYSLGWRQESGDEGRDSLSLSHSLSRAWRRGART
jgi:hypothetical protein